MFMICLLSFWFWYFDIILYWFCCGICSCVKDCYVFCICCVDVDIDVMEISFNVDCILF